jgi:hypothetical protein
MRFPPAKSGDEHAPHFGSSAGSNALRRFSSQTGVAGLQVEAREMAERAEHENSVVGNEWRGAGELP